MLILKTSELQMRMDGHTRLPNEEKGWSFFGQF